MNNKALSQRRHEIKERYHDIFGESSIPKFVIILLLIALIVSIALGIFWSFEPKRFDVNEYTALKLQKHNQTSVIGSTTTATLIGVAATLLDKNGGYLSNDKLPPGVWLDNMPSWEFGVLTQVRDLAEAMRDNFSRSQSQSVEDPDLAEADPLFSTTNDRWLFPSSEGEYRKAIKRLDSYLIRLSDTAQQDAQFYTRADNLNVWLAVVSSRLGSLSQRLSASVGKPRLNTDLAGEPEARQSTNNAKELTTKTSWWDIDNVFFEARGTSWALIQILSAIEVDFQDVLKKKNALVSLQQIIRELEATQDPILSPLILNGTGFGMTANHSLVMASYISRANAGIIDLRDLLSKG